MRFKGAFIRNELFITPAIGVINERGYYGYFQIQKQVD